MNYSNAYLYHAANFDVSRSPVPRKALLAVGTCNIGEPRPCPIPCYTIPPENDPTEYAREGKIVIDIAREVIGMLCVFGYATRKTLIDLIVLRGYRINPTLIAKVFNWLELHYFIDTVNIESDNISTPVHSLTTNGLYAARRMKFAYHPKLYARERSENVVKTFARTAQIVSHFLASGLPIDSFCTRKMIVTDVDAGGIVRPSAHMRIGDELVVLEVIRRYQGWEDDVLDKLTRYDVLEKTMHQVECTSELAKPTDELTLIINGEDFEMNSRIDSLIREHGLLIRPLYTEDLLTFGTCFSKALYGFDDNGSTELYDMLIPAAA